MTTKTQAPTVLEMVSSPAEGEVLVPYQPLSPIGNQKSLKGLLERNMASLKQILPKHVSPERLVKTLLMAVSRQPDLLECTQESIIEGVMRSAELGLDLSGTLGEAYLVPFNTKIKIPDKSAKGYCEEFRKLATFIPGYRGLAKLARQSGEVGRIEAEPVYEADRFVFKKGTTAALEFEPAFTSPDRGKCLGYYALIMTKDDSQPLVAEFMSMKQVKAIQAQAKSGKSPAWRNHFDEMGRKTVFRRAAKWAPLSGEKWQNALSADNADFDLDSFEVVEATATAAPSAAAIIGEPEAPTINAGAREYVDGLIDNNTAAQDINMGLLAAGLLKEGQTWAYVAASVTAGDIKDALGG